MAQSGDRGVKLPFAVGVESGQLQLVEPLDYEAERFYSFQVQAFKAAAEFEVKARGRHG